MHKSKITINMLNLPYKTRIRVEKVKGEKNLCHRFQIVSVQATWQWNCGMQNEEKGTAISIANDLNTRGMGWKWCMKLGRRELWIWMENEDEEIARQSELWIVTVWRKEVKERCKVVWHTALEIWNQEQMRQCWENMLMKILAPEIINCRFITSGF